MLSDKKWIHFLGAAGIGMSGIALILLKMGYKVSGSDLESNSLTKELERLGASIKKGHRAANLPRGAGLVVYSSSISKGNPEYVEAVRRGLPIVHRAEVLGGLMDTKTGITVTGTHGKTTTTSLVSVMLEKAGLDPSAVIGGEVGLFDSNAKFGNGEYFVAEADESDGSFIHIHPRYSVITNIEMEHMDYYKSMDEMVAAFRSFINNTKKGGIVFYNYEDANIKKALEGFKGNTASFGFSRQAEVYPAGIRMDGFRASYDCVYKGKTLGRVELNIPGRHNISNSMAAILVALELGIGFEKAASAVRDFTGARRRFHLRAERDGVMLIDDYAHHPTEIRAVLEACRNWKDRRVIAVFQPHRYTRVLHLADEFGKCFGGADKLILTDIYAASEKPIEGISAGTISDRAIKNGVGDVVVMDKDMIADHIMAIKKPGDIILIMGAGSIKKVADDLSARMNGE